MFADNLVRLPIQSISVIRGERQRKEVGDIDELVQSIARIGLIQPIVVKQGDIPGGDVTLVVGERRLAACKKLGWQDIPVRFVHELSKVESKIIELEENMKRLNLTWQENFNAVMTIHELHRVMEPSWGQKDTARSISLSPAMVSKYFKISSYMGDPRIAKADTLQQAFNIVERLESRREHNAFNEVVNGTDVKPDFEAPPPESKREGPEEFANTPTVKVSSAGTSVPKDILCESFLEWAPNYQGQKFNLIHCDFPFGINFNEGPIGLGNEYESYDDNPETYFELLDCLVENFWNFSSMSAHIMFWYSTKHYDETVNKFKKLPIQWSQHPLIWVHSDGSGISPDPKHDPRHIYDTCLFGTVGGRNTTRVVHDAYNCHTDHRLHPSTKPEPLLRHFMSMLVDEYTYLLDPTCGSGSALRAAESLGASRVLGLEIDEGYCETARKALRETRAKAALYGAYL